MLSPEMPGPMFIRILRSEDIEVRRIEPKCRAPGNAGPGVYLQPKSTGLRQNVGHSRMPGPACLETPSSAGSKAWGLKMPGPALICVMTYEDIEFHKIETKCGALGNAGPRFYLQPKSTGLRPNVGLTKIPSPAFLETPNSTGPWVRLRISTKCGDPGNAGPGVLFVCVMRSSGIEFRRIETKCRASGNAGPGVFRPHIWLSETPGPAFSHRTRGSPKCWARRFWRQNLIG